MLCFESPCHDAAWNLALEEYLFARCREDLLLIWRNSPCIVIGKNQYAAREVDLEKAGRLAIPVIRRSTGGGAVYQDMGNLNFSFLTADGDDENLFGAFLHSLLTALQSLGIKAEYNGRNDLCVNDLKISGSAAKAEGGRLLHHCTMLIDCDLERMAELLTPDREKLRRNGVRSVRSRVANLQSFSPELTGAKLIAALLRQMPAATPFVLPADAASEICAIAAEKYANPQWNFRLFE